MRFEKVRTSVTMSSLSSRALKYTKRQAQLSKFQRSQMEGNQLWQLSYRLVRWKRLCNTDGQELRLSDPATMDIVIHILLAVSPQPSGSQHNQQDYGTSLIVVEQQHEILSWGNIIKPNIECNDKQYKTPDMRCLLFIIILK